VSRKATVLRGSTLTNSLLQSFVVRVDGWCEYPDDLLAVMRDVYLVRKQDGSVFPAEGTSLTKI